MFCPVMCLVVGVSMCEISGRTETYRAFEIDNDTIRPSLVTAPSSEASVAGIQSAACVIH